MRRQASAIDTGDVLREPAKFCDEIRSLVGERFRAAIEQFNRPAKILRLLFTNARAELYVRQLARLSDLSLQTVQDELAKLEAARLVASWSNGYHRFYRADSKHPLYATLRKLVVRAASQAKPQPRARGQRRAGRR